MSQVKKTLLDELQQELKSALGTRTFLVVTDIKNRHKITGIVLNGTLTASDLDNLALIMDDYEGKYGDDPTT